MTSLTRAALVLAVSVAASCRDSTLPEWELRSAQARWESHGAESYSMTVTRYCFFCPLEGTGPVVVTVENGVVQSRSFALTSTAVPTAYAPSFPTIDGLFEIVESARRDDDVRLDVSFDPKYGYPSRIGIVRPGAMDGDMVIEARDLVLR